MPRTIHFHLDEDVDPAIAEGLRRRGIDVTTSQEAGLLGATDPMQLAYAHAKQQRVMARSPQGEGTPTVTTHRKPKL
jgi:hypothetical protein